MTPAPFSVSWDEVAMERVLSRVRDYRFPPSPGDGGWTWGCDAGFLRALCDRWTGGYNWRAAVADLNRFPQFTASVRGLNLHFVHVRGEGAVRRPLLLSHGWPGSHHEFWDAIEPLAFPSRSGGDAADAFDVVVPSLPGYGFSGARAAPIDQREVARMSRALMCDVLGHDRFLAHGGDWGALVTGWLGVDHAEALRGIHLTALMLSARPAPETAAEKEWAARRDAVQEEMGAYAQLQATKPQSLAWAMADNPVAQAAWIAERYHDWTDLRERDFADTVPMDRLLTAIMIYVMTESFATSTWFYRAARDGGARKMPEGRRCTVPTGFAAFPDPRLPPPPRCYVEREYDVAHWSDMPRGGHFPGIEEPGLLVAELRAWARTLG